MPRFFTADVSGNSIITTGEDARHIGYSLRMKPGDEITFCNSGTEYICRISEMTSDSVVSGIVETRPTESEPTVFLTLYQAYPKSDKLELIVQKAVELGVSRIVPFTSKRCVAKPPADKSGAKRTERLNKKALEAAKQSGRGVIPKVSEFCSFRDALARAGEFDVLLLPYESAEGIAYAREVIAQAADLPAGSKVAVFIGPEGGFAQEEVAAAQEKGAKVITLGNRILRTETAGLAVLSILMFSMEQ